MTVDADRRSPPCVLVIFGASGDLTARKLLPALARLAGYGALPPEVALVGVARTPMTDDEFGDLCRRSVSGDGDERWRALTAAARYVHGGYDDPGHLPAAGRGDGPVRSPARHRRQPRLLLRHAHPALYAFQVTPTDRTPR